jgi:hypothetical protein
MISQKNQKMNGFKKENMLPPGAISTKMFDLCMDILKTGFASEIIELKGESRRK